MRGSDFVATMAVRCVGRLLLFQVLVAWCAAKHVTINVDELTAARLGAEVRETAENLLHTGIYSHVHLDPQQVEVVRPVKVSREGELVSHALEHSHEHGHARARRDLHRVEHTLPHCVHYNLTVDGRELRLDLRPSVTFITPAMIVERQSAGLHTRTKPKPSATACHYTGTVRGQPSSQVAISACDGLAGLLRTEHGEYWIEPSNHVANEEEGRPHVVFRRSAMDKIAAHHRAKRTVDNPIRRNTNMPQYRNRNLSQNRHNGNTQLNFNNRRNPNQRRHHNENKEAADKRRREFLEQRRRRLEALRKNPTEYRRNQTELRMADRRAQAQSDSKSMSIEASKSMEHSVEGTKKKNRKKLTEEQRLRRIKNRRRRRKRSKNCATKEPPYTWNNKNQNRDMSRKNNNRYSDVGRRSARSVSKPRHVEVLLVADKTMSEFHSQGDLETYLLIIMNMVSLLYMDPSIGNYIKVVVVKIILVEDIHAAPELEVSSNADSTLDSFCRWQQHLNPDNDENPHHHDVAILVTRQDICSKHDIYCSTLGVAHVAGMCKPDHSCSVNEDNGIALAHTITHELGHNFGLYHDTEKIGCHRREGLTLHVMTPIFEADTVQVAWSRCSKRDVTNFLDAGLGECLSDQPSQFEYEYPEMPAGEIYDAAYQCHLQFGEKAEVCSPQGELCERLWCYINNSCMTALRPPAPGTTCGNDMWCRNQTCVHKTTKPTPRNGGWGPWSEWSACSRTCGAGVSTQNRECNNPEPENNGAYCIGDRSRYRVCNWESCPKNEPTFREIQCAKYNNMTYKNETTADWVPYFDQDKPCELQCESRDGTSDLDMLGAFVADGTPCKQVLGARDLCITGVCYKVGCDWIVDSDKEEDACGVCGGNGSDCKTVKGIYDKGTTRQSGFSEVAVIPAGSRNVKIEEKVSPGNFISIGSARRKRFYFNGTRNAVVTEYFVAGAQVIYERDRDWEKVRIPGPIAEDIKVYQRIFKGKHRNPGVTYQYTVVNHHRYRLSEWEPCSVSCGLGRMSRRYECVDTHHKVVSLTRCEHIEPPQYVAMMRQCRMPACPARAAPHTHWWVGPWSPCSDHCRMLGREAIKQRSVHCVNKVLNKVVSDAECDVSIKPAGSMRCLELPAC